MDSAHRAVNFDIGDLVNLDFDGALGSTWLAGNQSLPHLFLGARLPDT
jgi:hypothetical protein